MIRRWLGRTRYHQQANEVNVRVMRAERLARSYRQADQQLRRH